MRPILAVIALALAAGFVAIAARHRAESDTKLPAPAPSAAASAGALDVDSGPRGAHVFVDGGYRGRTPLHLEGLSAGEHLIRLEMRGYLEVESVKAVPDGGRSSFFAPLRRR